MSHLHTKYKIYLECPKCKNQKHVFYYIDRLIIEKTENTITFTDRKNYHCKNCGHFWETHTHE